MRVAEMLALVLAVSHCSKAPRPVASSEPDAAPAVAASSPLVVDAAPAADSGPETSDASADSVGQAVPVPRKDAPALRYGRLGRTACEAELVRRKIPFTRAEATFGVRSPVRLTGPMRGVTIRSEASPKRRAKARFEIFDCRLVLALDDFMEIVAAHDVVEILHMSAFRSFKERGCLSKVGNKQHCGALAVDVGTFVKKDGTKLVVERDYGGRIGQGTCTSTTGPAPPSTEGKELWGFVCESARRTLFNVILTPNFNVDHKNHFHLEVTPGVDWILVH